MIRSNDLEDFAKAIDDVVAQGAFYVAIAVGGAIAFGCFLLSGVARRGVS